MRARQEFERVERENLGAGDTAGRARKDHSAATPAPETTTATEANDIDDTTRRRVGDNERKTSKGAGQCDATSASAWVAATPRSTTIFVSGAG